MVNLIAASPLYVSNTLINTYLFQNLPIEILNAIFEVAGRDTWPDLIRVNREWKVIITELAKRSYLKIILAWNHFLSNCSKREPSFLSLVEINEAYLNKEIQSLRFFSRYINEISAFLAKLQKEDFDSLAECLKRNCYSQNFPHQALFFAILGLTECRRDYQTASFKEKNLMSLFLTFSLDKEYYIPFQMIRFFHCVNFQNLACITLYNHLKIIGDTTRSSVLDKMIGDDYRLIKAIETMHDRPCQAFEMALEIKDLAIRDVAYTYIFKKCIEGQRSDLAGIVFDAMNSDNIFIDHHLKINQTLAKAAQPYYGWWNSLTNHLFEKKLDHLTLKDICFRETVAYIIYSGDLKAARGFQFEIKIPYVKPESFIVQILVEAFEDIKDLEKSLKAFDALFSNKTQKIALLEKLLNCFYKTHLDLAMDIVHHACLENFLKDKFLKKIFNYWLVEDLIKGFNVATQLFSKKLKNKCYYKICLEGLKGRLSTEKVFKIACYLDEEDKKNKILKKLKKIKIQDCKIS